MRPKQKQRKKQREKKRKTEVPFLLTFHFTPTSILLKKKLSILVVVFSLKYLLILQRNLNQKRLSQGMVQTGKKRDLKICRTYKVSQ